MNGTELTRLSRKCEEYAGKDHPGSGLVKQAIHLGKLLVSGMLDESQVESASTKVQGIIGDLKSIIEQASGADATPALDLLDILRILGAQQLNETWYNQHRGRLSAIALEIAMDKTIEKGPENAAVSGAADAANAPAGDSTSEGKL